MKRKQFGNDKTSSEEIPGNLKVLMYHRIADDERLCQAHWTLVHLKAFRSQLELLDRWGFTAITFDDYRLFLEGELNLPRKPVILTFDDGYLDTYENAFPLLQEYGMKAVVFAIGNQQIKTNVWDRSLGLPTGPLVDGKQLVEMHAAGFEIGAHSLNHVKLTTLTGDEAWQEISCPKTILESLLNSTVRSFSYPYGLVNGKIKRMVADAGYTFACGVCTGPASFGVEPFEIRRIAVPGTMGPVGFGIRLLTPFQRYEWIRWKARESLIGFNGRSNDKVQLLWEKKERAHSNLS